MPCTIPFRYLVSEEAREMRLRWLYWLLIGYAIFRVFERSIKAVTEPWAWNTDQVVFVIFLWALVALCAWVAFDLLRYGPKTARTRWNSFAAASAAAWTDPKKTFRYISLWIVVALVLVTYFNMTQH